MIKCKTRKYSLKNEYDCVGVDFLIHDPSDGFFHRRMNNKTSEIM
jgi:hypothetical protein